MDNQSTTFEEEEVAPADRPDALTPKQELALQAVLTHPTLKEAAAAAGISEPTLWRYKKVPEFARRLREVRGEMSDHVATRLQQGAGDAASFLHKLVNKEDAPLGYRISAARTMLDYAFRGVAIEELRAEQEELKEHLRRKQEEEELSEQYYEA